VDGSSHVAYINDSRQTFVTRTNGTKRSWVENNWTPRTSSPRRRSGTRWHNPSYNRSLGAFAYPIDALDTTPSTTCSSTDRHTTRRRPRLRLPSRGPVVGLLQL